ncbi:MAG: DUF3604 domain-containing protein [bacterium]|nr:DUF3604 domain-containing protein [bacterium]
MQPEARRIGKWQAIGPLRKIVGLAFLALACGDPPLAEENYSVASAAKPPVPEAACLDRNPLRNAYFGDLHVHTSASSDAWMFDVRLGPEDAYRFAFGDPVLLPPLDSQGRGTREVRIDRPLDFAAVTDHAEFLAEGKLCTDPSAPGYEGSFCKAFRKGEGRTPQLVFQIMSPITWRDDEVCGADGVRCRDATASMWQRNIDAAQRWNDTSERCERTTFIAYEYSSFRLGSNLHRNVVFKNEVVPRQPVSYLDAHRGWELWDLLDRGCRKTASGCDVLAIPHNSNISNGRMFAVDYPGASSREEQAARAALRIEIEPIIEIFQHKGDSECRRGVPGVMDNEDELCDWERFENAAFSRFSETANPGACYDGPLADSLPRLGPSCLSRLSYARYVLTEGLAEEERIGVNPFKFGLSASTDSHNALAGGVEERSYPGHLGKGDLSPSKRTNYSPEIAGNANNNPGGLIGVWAQENDRAALFDAMRRKEVFGTSGPRIVPRLFAAWTLPEDLCGADDLVARADTAGVAMGGDLPPAPDSSAAPSFLSLALADAGTLDFPGNPLQRLQIIKGWIDGDGERRQAVYEVAGDPSNGASVDTDTCETSGEGFQQLCSVWTDPDFRPEQRAVYYMRAVENPSCRYNAWQCIGLEGKDRPADCDDPDRKLVIQERAWTSPIWYTPAG